MGTPDVACALSPVISVSVAERGATDGWSGAAQCGLIINSVLCCCGAVDGCCVTSVQLNRWFFSPLSDSSFYNLHLSPPSADSSSPSPVPPVSPRLPQRRTSGVIMDHVNASEATRLESHCCGVHDQQALFSRPPLSPPLPQIISAFLRCRPLAPS